MKRNWMRTDRLWCLFLILAVSQVTRSNSKTTDQVKLPIPTKESLPQVAKVLKAATYLEHDDELEKNFERQRDNYKRPPRKLGADELDKNTQELLQEYQGVIGRPGVDFPILPSIPYTDFSCKKVKKPGYYADPETDCQVFHICDNGRKVSFLCPNGTVFRQSHLICDWWFRVDCERSIELYEESAEQFATDQRTFRERSEALAKAMLKVTTVSPQTNDRVVTDRSFGPSTTVFNSESRLPERARYFNGFSRDESQVPAETGSFAGSQYQSNFNNFNSQSKTQNTNWNQNTFKSSNNYQKPSFSTEQPIWNQANNYQTLSYQPQSTTTPQSTRNQAAVANSYQSVSYQTQSTTTEQPSGINSFQPNYQTQYSTNDQLNKNQAVTDSQVPYQSQPSTITPQIDWSQGNSDNYQSQPVSYQTLPTSSEPQTNWNSQSTKGFGTENYQSYVPTTTQVNWNQDSSSFRSVNYQTPSTTAIPQVSWNEQSTNNFPTENYQPSVTTTQSTPISWSNQNLNNFGNMNHQKQLTTTEAQTNWNQGVNNLQSNNFQPLSETTIQPDWNQETDTAQPGLYQPQQPTTVFPVTDNEQTVPAKESQVPAESASFVGHQNSNGLNFQSNNYYSQHASQTNAPSTTYPTTSSYSNDYSPSGAFSFVEYQRSPDTLIPRIVSTQAPQITTTVFDYKAVSNSTLSPTGETLIPNMINSLQTLSDNNLIFDFDGQNPYQSQTNEGDDELNSVALYFNNVKNQQVTTVASDLQFNYAEQTSKAYDNGVSSAGIDSFQTTKMPPVDGLRLPAVLTQSTRDAYDKLFKNDTEEQPITFTATSTETSKTTTPSPSTTSVNIGFAQGLNLNRSSAELRELAAVFTRALTAYLDDPENFRKILAEVRPTEPPGVVKTGATEEQEVLDFSDDSKTQRNKPTVSSTTSTTSTTNLAAEINGMSQHINTDLSTTIPQYTTSPLIDITSKLTKTSNSDLQDYAPLADSEQLQVAGSQSFYSSRVNNIETAKTAKPAATSTLAWTTYPSINTEQEIKATTTLSPIYFTTTAEDLETTVIMQKAKEMFSHLKASDAGKLMNVMKSAQANDTVKRLVLLLVNDPNKENSPEQTRNNIIEALLDNSSADQESSSSSQPSAFVTSSQPSAFVTSSQPSAFATSSQPSVFYPASTPGIPFGQRLQEDGSPVVNGQYKKSRKTTRRRVVHRSRSISTSTSAPVTASDFQGASDVGPGLSSDSDTRAVELLKSLYSIASKWS